MHYENGMLNFIESKCHDQALNALIGAHVSFSVFSNSVCVNRD